MKTYSSKEQHEQKNPYVLVQFEEYGERTIASIIKSFSNKKLAEKYNELHGNSCSEVMTRRKYNSIISALM